MGIDVWEVIAAASTKPFGYMPFYPGPGLGGYCIPLDPFYLSWKASEYGMWTRFIELAGEINTQMPRYVVSRLVEALNEDSKSQLRGRRCGTGCPPARRCRAGHREGGGRFLSLCAWRHSSGQDSAPRASMARLLEGVIAGIQVPDSGARDVAGGIQVPGTLPALRFRRQFQVPSTWRAPGRPRVRLQHRAASVRSSRGRRCGTGRTRGAKARGLGMWRV
jgi:hypothetical protein